MKVGQNKINTPKIYWFFYCGLFILFERESAKEQHRKFCSELAAYLCTIADRFVTFSDIDDCIYCISSFVYDKVFLILLFHEIQQRLPLIHDLPQIGYIYIYNDEEIKNLTNDFYDSTQKFSNVRNVIYKLNNTLFDQLKRDVNVVETRLLPFTLCPITSIADKSIQDIGKDQASYRWNQLLLNAVLEIPKNAKSKQDMLDECKLKYSHSEPELRKIEQFEQTYEPDQAIWWSCM